MIRTKYETKIDETFDEVVSSAEKSLVTGLETDIWKARKNVHSFDR